MQYVRSLDGVRGVAIFIVMLYHYDFILEFGWTGVQLFFVLSGYLITSILLEDKSQSLGDYLKGFYWRRTLRIFPIYYLYLFFVTGIYLVANIPADFSQTFPFLFTYTYNLFPLVHDFKFDIFFTHFWSLSIEEQFYLIWPLIVYFLSVRNLRIFLIALALIAPLSRLLLANYLQSDAQISDDIVGQIVYRFTLSQWDSFVYGAAIPIFNLTSRVKSPSRLFGITLAAVIAVGAINYYTLTSHNIEMDFTSLGYKLGVISNYQHVWSYTLLDILFMTLIIWCLKSFKSRTSNLIFENPLLVFFGKISYGLYVYHWIIWMAFGKYLKPYFQVSAIGFIVYTLICLGLAYLSYIGIERPILSLKGKFFKRTSRVLI